MKLFVQFFKKNKWACSFLLGMFSMGIMLSYSQLLLNGKYCILLGDNASIYTPVIYQFVRNIKEGNSIFFSWTNSLGMDVSLANGFSAYNPFNFVLFLFPNLNPEIFTSFCIIIKTGIAAATFQLFCEKALKVNGYYSILFALLYSMCAFQIDSNVINIIWLDSMFMLPLVFLGVHLLVTEGKHILLSLSLSYLFITNFYMGYIVGVSAIIYFVLLLILSEERKLSRISTILRFILSGGVAVLVSSFAWLPAALFMLNNYANDSTTDCYLYANILDVISQMFIGKDTGTKGVMPDLYAGILTLLVFPYFFICKSIKLKKKLIYGILFGFYLLAIFVLPVYLFVHAFDSPDGWYFRFSFIISFLMCTMAVQAYEYINDINKKLLIIYAIVFFLINVLSSVLQPIRFDFETFKPLLPYLIINLIAIIVWIAIVICRKKYITSNYRNFAALVVFLTVFECVFNGFSSNYDVLDLKKDTFNAWSYSQKSTVNALKEDDGFYRISYYRDLFTNGDTFFGYNGITDFNTAENPNVRYFLTDLGVYTTPRVVQNFGTTAFSDLLLDVKYTVIGVHPYSIGYENYEPNIIERNILGLSFAVDDDILNCEFTDNPFENNNIVASSMLGDKIDIFKEIDKENVEIINDGIELLETGDGRYYLNDYSGEEGGIITFKVYQSDYDSDVYMYIDNEESIVYKKSFLYIDGYENSCEVKGFTSVSYLKKFEDYSDYKCVSIYSNDIEQQVMNNYRFGYLDKEAFDEFYQEMSKNVLNINNFSNGYVEGSVYTDKDSTLMFSSIPYSSGWEVYVDGNKTEIVSIFGDSFLGYRIEGAGDHNIVLKYKAKGVVLSFIISGIGSVLLFLLVLIGIYKKKNL